MCVCVCVCVCVRQGKSMVKRNFDAHTGRFRLDDLAELVLGVIKIQSGYRSWGGQCHGVSSCGTKVNRKLPISLAGCE